MCHRFSVEKLSRKRIADGIESTRFRSKNIPGHRGARDALRSWNWNLNDFYEPPFNAKERLIGVACQRIMNVNFWQRLVIQLKLRLCFTLFAVLSRRFVSNWNSLFPLPSLPFFPRAERFNYFDRTWLRKFARELLPRFTIKQHFCQVRGDRAGS